MASDGTRGNMGRVKKIAHLCRGSRALCGLPCREIYRFPVMSHEEEEEHDPTAAQSLLPTTAVRGITPPLRDHLERPRTTVLSRCRYTACVSSNACPPMGASRVSCVPGHMLSSLQTLEDLSRERRRDWLAPLVEVPR